MARYTGPKHRIARREKANIYGITSPSLERRLNVPPGMHGHKSTRKPSDYALQLREKQKAKRIYGVLERQFRKYFNQALKKKGSTAESLLQTLETRLDNIVYRLGFTPTRDMARQLVSHGHVYVDNNRLSIPSASPKVGSVITLKAKLLESPAVKKCLEEKNPAIPTWLERKGPVGKFVRLPGIDDIDIDVNTQLIIEFYSR